MCASSSLSLELSSASMAHVTARPGGMAIKQWSPGPLQTCCCQRMPSTRVNRNACAVRHDALHHRDLEGDQSSEARKRQQERVLRDDPNRRDHLRFDAGSRNIPRLTPMTPEFPPQLPLDSPASTSSTFGTVAAASVMAECLRVQADVPQRGALARTFGRSPLSDESRPWYLGALGELDVANRLGSLGDAWTVVHSVPIGTRGSDIDHVVVGAAGVFTINTKFHKDARVWVSSRKLLVNGQAKDHLRNSRYEATRTQKLLSTAAGMEVAVTGVIAIVGAKQITIREQPADIAVLDAARLTRWLKKQKPRLDQAHTAALSALVRNAATWADEPQHQSDISGFDALHRDVLGAKRVRMVWSGALLLAILGATVPVVLDHYSRVLGG